MFGYSNGSWKTSLEVMDWNDAVRERNKSMSYILGEMRGSGACLTFWGRCGDRGHVLHSGGDAGIEGMSYILGEMRGSRERVTLT